MSTPNLTINTNNINNDDRSPMQSPRSKSPTNNDSIKCPGAPKKIVIPVPRTPRVQNKNVCKQLFVQN
jgi:hypothetical protein